MGYKTLAQCFSWCLYLLTGHVVLYLVFLVAQNVPSVL